MAGRTGVSEPRSDLSSIFLWTFTHSLQALADCPRPHGFPVRVRAWVHLIAQGAVHVDAGHFNAQDLCQTPLLGLHFDPCQS